MVKHVLELYENGSGQQVNFDKSSLFFSSNCSQGARDCLARHLNIPQGRGFGKYLGLKSEFGHSKKEVFEEIREKVATCVHGWAENFLTMAGKEVLLKAVALALPTYMMSCFLLSQGVCEDILRALASFWWGSQGTRKGLHWAKWKKLTQRKECGGLDFKDLFCFNRAMLAKIGWHLLSQLNSLLHQVLQAKYFPNGSFLEAQLGRGPSWGWRSMLKGRQALMAGLRWRIGDGQSVNVQRDPWLPMPYHFKVRTPSPLLPKRVSDLIDPILRQWDVHTDSGRDGLLSSIAYGLWRLWKCRNTLVFEGTTVHPAEAVEFMYKQHNEFLQTKEQGTETTPSYGVGGVQPSMGTQQWSCPPMAFAKINCEGAWTSQTLRGGWGWVIRNASGVFKGVGREGGVRCGSAIAAEAEALRAGLCAGLDQGWQRVVLEFDSKLMIDMLTGAVVLTPGLKV
ncbi:uncharacterized protein LOC110772850 [Prunus avium]|uniref:Uncharacterized protein LOC110772850 n=1 Tax=Prunus avium TaxID=42229 RepID=A0A6P5U101_PRUAV|nr:uncharacterized protein LOC110772850 [Prunus avium]